MTTTDLRLSLIALLASVYVSAWWAFGAHAPSPTASLPPEAPTPEPPQVPTWYPDVPPAARPAVQVPAGWRIAERTPAPTSQVGARPAPIVRARPGRIRTRSS
ncbi:MAG: hypothetical protein R3B72_45085 [Polyangiaceae bacterium]